MSWLLAQLYDVAMRRFERARLSRWRAEMLAELEGSVLEIGAGTGANVPHYPPGADVVLVEPDPHMRRKLEQHASGHDIRAAEAGALPFADGSFDAVVSTLVLCSVGDLGEAVAEMARVLRPGGRAIFIEHEAAPPGSAEARWQRRLDPLWCRLAGGCHMTRDPERAFRDAGFSVAIVDRHVEPSARLFPIVRGIASR